MGPILVTGASGFVGAELCAELLRRKMVVRAVVREGATLAMPGCEIAIISGLAAQTDWSGVLEGVATVVHLAARVHVMREDASHPLDEFHTVNVAGTECLARAAAAAGVKRFVYVSSIKVNGEATKGDQQFTESSTAAPQDPYGISKWQAEQALQRVSAETGLELVIVRPPLVYGPKVKGNFLLMLNALRRRLPLPFASVRNRRSLIFIGNLVDALIACSIHPAAAMQTYLVSDGEDVSTPDLLRRIGEAMRSPAVLLPCPPMLLRLGARLFNKSEQADRLLGSLRVDGRKICHELAWTPPYSLQQGLEAMVER